MTMAMTVWSRFYADSTTHQSLLLSDGADVELKCPKAYGKMTVDATGALMCVKNDDLMAYNLTSKCVSHSTHVPYVHSL